MSTYLLAFVVSNFVSSPERGKYKVHARPQEIEAHHTNYALRESEKLLSAIESIVGVEYALEKLDEVAIPDDYFQYGAMENWGLVTYR